MLTRWEPFRELVSLREAMDRLFEESSVRPGRRLGVAEGALDVALDIYQTDDEVVARASLPGVRPEDLEVTVVGDMLTIKGETKVEEQVKREDYLRQERRYGSFARSVAIPIPIQGDKVRAHYEHGVLTVTMPKAEEVKPKTIKVQARQATEGKKA